MQELWARAKNPLNALLLSLAIIVYFLGDVRAAVVISVIALLAIVTAFIQEHHSNDAAAKLRTMVKITASVKRRGAGTARSRRYCAAYSGRHYRPIYGCLAPRICSSISRPYPARLCLPFAVTLDGGVADPFDLPNLCFMGGSVFSGFGTGVIVHTGAKTYFGQLADQIAGRRELTSFDKGVNRFIWLMIRFMLVMVPGVFLINGLTKGNWLEALLFAVAVAVGLTPEMLPMIVIANLAKGAIAMSKKRVIVKRLNAIQNFGDGRLVHRQDRHSDARPYHPQAPYRHSAMIANVGIVMAIWACGLAGGIRG